MENPSTLFLREETRLANSMCGEWNLTNSLMKRLLTVSTILLATYVSGFSQMTGGGQTSNVQVKQASQKNSWSVLHVGLSQPIGKFKENNLTVPFNEAVGAKPGFYFAFDGASYFGSASSNEFKLGFSWNTGLAINGVNWESWVPGSTNFEGTPFLTTDLKLGIIGTYEITEEVKVDGFFRLGVNLGASGTGYWDGSSYEELYSESVGLGFGTIFGASFRFRKLFTTLQVSPGKLKYTYTGSINSDIIVPISTMRLGLGFQFGKNQ